MDEISALPASSMATPTTPSLERLYQVKARTGLSRSEIYRRIASGDFPRQVKVGSSSLWSTQEVDAWILDRLASRTPTG